MIKYCIITQMSIIRKRSESENHVYRFLKETAKVFFMIRNFKLFMNAVRKVQRLFIIKRESTPFRIRAY